MSKKIWWILLAITVLAVGFRFYALGVYPSGFHSDEASFGYSAYSMLRTGADEYGTKFSLFLKSFGDYKSAMYAYLTVPAVSVFGLTPFAVRLPSAVFGSLYPLLVFFLIREMTKKTSVALMSAFLIAINPWHINFSRTASENIHSLWFLTLGALLLWQGIEKKQIGRWLGGLFFFFTSALTYAPTTVFVWPFLFAWAVLGKGLKKKMRLSLIAAVCVLGIITVVLYRQTGFERLSQVNIFSNPGVSLVMEEQLREDGVAGVPLFIVRMVHNKVVNYGLTIVSNYFKHVDLRFLFLEGGLPIRMVVPSMGLFYLFELPLFLLGLAVCVRQLKAVHILLLLWFFLAPLGGVIAFAETPSMYRASWEILPFEAVSALGLVAVYDWLKRYKWFVRVIIGGAFLLVMSWNVVYYLNQYYVHLEVHRPWYRGNGYEGLVRAVEELKGNYKEVVITKAHESPYIYFLFYTKYDPKKYQAEGSPRDLQFSGFDQYRFYEGACPIEKGSIQELKLESNVLYVDSGECQLPDRGATLVRTIRRGDQSPAFQLVEVDPEVIAETRLSSTK